MADQSISQLPVAVAPLTGDELAVVVQNGITKQGGNTHGDITKGGITKRAYYKDGV
jgi:hypothetical protein